MVAALHTTALHARWFCLTRQALLTKLPVKDDRTERFKITRMVNDVPATPSTSCATTTLRQTSTFLSSVSSVTAHLAWSRPKFCVLCAEVRWAQPSSRSLPLLSTTYCCLICSPREHMHANYKRHITDLNLSRFVVSPQHGVMTYNSLVTIMASGRFAVIGSEH